MRFLALIAICSISPVFSFAEDGCGGYPEFRDRFNQARVECKDFSDAIVPGEQGCELREEVAASSDYFRCVLTKDYINWMDDEDNFIWDQAIKEFEEIQVEDELDGLAALCQEQTLAIQRDELEEVAAELLSPGVDVGEQEECWNTDEAEEEVKRVYAFICLQIAIVNNRPPEC